MRRRIAGEPLPDDEIIRGHGTLMPELGRELQKLAFAETKGYKQVDFPLETLAETTAAGGTPSVTTARLPQPQD